MFEHLWNFVNRRAVFLAAFWLMVFAHAVDVLSSYFCKFVVGCEEENEILRDPITHQFIVWKGIAIKSVFILLWPVPISFLLYRVTRSWFLASLPFFYEAAVAWQTNVPNIEFVIFGR